MTTEAAGGADYAMRLEVQRPDTQSRLTNFPLGIGILIRYILLIPHFVILLFLQVAAFVVYFIATFAILFTGTYPRGMYNFSVTVLRWSTNVNGYINSLYDKYPPFSGEQQDYPLSFDVTYPEQSSRLLNLPLIGYYIKALLLIPHFVVLFFLGIAAAVVVFIAQFAILFTGSFPEGMHRFVVGVTRWSTRTTAYLVALTDKYPPFSLS